MKRITRAKTYKTGRFAIALDLPPFAFVAIANQVSANVGLEPLAHAGSSPSNTDVSIAFRSSLIASAILALPLVVTLPRRCALRGNVFGILSGALLIHLRS